MSLANWERNGWLSSHQTSPAEIGDLLALVDRDLADADADSVSPDWRFNIAYNAALQAAKAALAASGYRTPGGGGDHYRSIESLRHTIGLEAAVVARLEAARRRRNIAEYDRAGVSTDADAAEMRALAADVAERLRSWLRDTHPELL